MRHLSTKKKLSRPKGHRVHMMNNMLNSLLMQGRIQTTESRAKVLRVAVDRVIVMSKKKELREAIRYLHRNGVNETTSRKLCSTLLKRFEGRNSGFTRIIPIKFRQGDNAKVVQIELVS